MTTADRLKTLREAEAQNRARIAAWQARRRAAAQAEALQSIRDSDTPTILPDEAAKALGVAPQSLRVAAREDPDALGFPVIHIGSRTLIPRAAFLRCIDGENGGVGDGEADEALAGVQDSAGRRAAAGGQL